MRWGRCGAVQPTAPLPCGDCHVMWLFCELPTAFPRTGTGVLWVLTATTGVSHLQGDMMTKRQLVVVRRFRVSLLWSVRSGLVVSIYAHHPTHTLGRVAWARRPVGEW